MKIETKFFLTQLTGLTMIYLQYGSSPFSLHTCILYSVIAAKFSQLNFENEEYSFKWQISAERTDWVCTENKLKASVGSCPTKFAKAQMEKANSGLKRKIPTVCVLETRNSQN